MIRTRWAAIGAAVAVTLGAGGIGLVSATTPADAATFVPIEPCRLFDTRPDFQVGARSTPLGPDETFTVAAHGDNGECTGIPSTATGLGLNVTAVDPTQATVLTIWGDGDRPNASNLNPTPGEPPTPNAVTGDLTAAGELKVWNAFGSVHVLADINGYYVDHDHDDRYYTEAEVDALTAPATVVFSQGTNDITPNASSTIAVSYFAGGSTISGAGLAQMSLTGPYMIGDATYELTSIEYCLSGFGGGTVDAVVVYEHGIDLVVGASATDDTDRTTPGCHVFEVGLVNPEGFDFGIRKANTGGTFTLTGVTTTWTPVAP